MRISTNQIYRSGIESIQRNQQEINRTQGQLSSGRRILTPSDDPAGAVQALQFRTEIDRVKQYQRNGTMLTQRLSYSETVLESVVGGLQRVRQLALQANNASQTTETRGFMAGEIAQSLTELYQLSNTRDANGEYIFAGVKSDAPPFARNPDGGAVYFGTETPRSLQISAVRLIPFGDAGAPLFMEIPRGNGSFVVQETPGNTGAGVVNTAEVTDLAAWPRAETYTVLFHEEAGQLQYRVTDDPDDPVFDPASWQDFATGSPLVFPNPPGAIARVTIDGPPDPGDRYTISNAGTQPLFDTYKELVDLLESGASGARLANAINRSLVDLDQGLTRVLDTRASLGARLQAGESQNGINEDQLLQLRSTLSDIEDLDYAEAIGRFSLQQAALQAAQQTYVQVQRLSLFNYL